MSTVETGLSHPKAIHGYRTLLVMHKIIKFISMITKIVFVRQFKTKIKFKKQIFARLQNSFFLRKEHHQMGDWE